MQQTKRRSKKGVILLALTIAMLVLAFVPAALASPPAQSQLTPDVGMGPGSVYAQGNIDWFASAPNGDYWPNIDGTSFMTWINLPVPALAQGTAGPTLNVGTIAYKVDGLPVGGIAVPVSAGPPQNIAYGNTVEGLHTVESMLKETTLTVHQLVAKPWVSDVYGIDTTEPDWQHITGIDDACYYNVDVKFSAIVSDPAGSGVAPTPTASWDTTSSATNGRPAKQLAWDKWTWEVTGTVFAPKVLDATTQTFLSDTITFSATDMVGNTHVHNQLVKFDVLAPITGYTITPAGSDVQSGWTKGPVTVNFKSADPNWPNSSGVDYTEYKVLTSTTTAVPPAPTSGTSKGTSVTITATAPIGPTYVYYRSVDKACPSGNKEVWNLVMVFIDNDAPALSDTVPTWWINSNEGFREQDCDVILTASDHNSGIAPPGITWTIEGHPPFGGTSIGNEVHIPILPLALGDGIRNLVYSAKDKAGNASEVTTQIKIDTRGPVTDGASGWINGLAPYVLTATDQAPGAGVAATVYRVDQKTPWSVNAAATAAVTLDTSISIPGTPVQGAVHTIDFASVDAALPLCFDPVEWAKLDPAVPSWHLGNWELDILNILKTGAAYKSRTVKLDIVAPAVTAMDPKNGNWQTGPAVVNFSGTDVGSGYSHTEWSTDGGTTWTSGEVASVGGDGEITVTYRGVDNVGLMSANQTITVLVASTHPTVTGGNVTVKKGHKATFAFNVTAVTPTAQVIIQIRTKSGRTVSTHHYMNVTTNADMTRSFKVNLKKGKYNIRIGAVDLAGNTQTQRGGGTLTVR